MFYVFVSLAVAIWTHNCVSGNTHHAKIRTQASEQGTTRIYLLTFNYLI